MGASGKRYLAERVGFEPTERFPVHSISSAASSTTPAPLLNQPQKSTKFTKIFLRFLCLFVAKNCGGEGGIRTHGGRKPTPVFETGALIHYATSPRLEKLLHQRAAFRFQYARADLDPVIQEIRVADSKATRHRTCPLIRRAVN